MRTWDAIVVGGGIIGLSLSLELRKQRLRVLVIERGTPGRESSHAAAGMLADSPLEIAAALRSLAAASARMYPGFVAELEQDSGIEVDLRREGKILLLSPEAVQSSREHSECGEALSPEDLLSVEPSLESGRRRALYLAESSVDPRALVAAVLCAARRHQVDIVPETCATEVVVEQGRAVGVRTENSVYQGAAVVNCAGAWAGELGGTRFPTRPVKGQMLCLRGGPALGHVIQAPEVYLVPRSDGRILVGASVEEAGYDKRTDAAILDRMRSAALELVPALSQAWPQEAWAGLRPGTPDNLPLLGATTVPGYWVAAGHFRDGILLAPITARVMAQLVASIPVEHDLSRFSPGRFVC